MVIFGTSLELVSDDDNDVGGVLQLFLRRQEIPVSKVERYVLPHISSLFNPHIIFNQKVTKICF